MNELKELKVVFKAENPETAGELIADCFYENDITGVVIESPDIKTDDWGDDAILRDKNSVSGYIYEEVNIEKIKEDISSLAKRLKIEIEFELKTIKEEDWAHSWKDYFYPVEISENIVIRPSWRELEKDYEIVIDIDPGMAFGSGSHATTTLCIKMLSEYVENGKSLLDIGCGSGILMVAGAKLGAVGITGLDNDPVAVDITDENMKLNGIEKNRYEVFKSDLLGKVGNEYDVIVANILAEVILDLIPDLSKVSHEKTSFIFSGIIEEKKEMVIEKMKEFKIIPEKIYEEGGWVAISGVYKN